MRDFLHMKTLLRLVISLVPALAFGAVSIPPSDINPIPAYSLLGRTSGTQGAGQSLTIGANGITFLGTPSSANLRGWVSDETGTGLLYFQGGDLGTPSAGVLTNATGYPVASLANLGTGVATALAVNVGSAGAFVTFNGALGTPSSGTLTNATGLPISSGLSGLGTGVATALAINTGSAGAFQVNNASGAGLTSLTAANISVGALANGMTATTQSASDNSTKIATTAYADSAVAAGVTASSTTTFTNKRITPRITSITSSATPTVNTDNCDCVTITALAAAITSMTTNLSGTPNNFDRLLYRIKDDGTGRAITWGASFASRGATLPTTTTASKVLYVGFVWNSVAGVWDCIAVSTEA